MNKMYRMNVQKFTKIIHWEKKKTEKKRKCGIGTGTERDQLQDRGLRNTHVHREIQKTLVLGSVFGCELCPLIVAVMLVRHIQASLLMEALGIDVGR